MSISDESPSRRQIFLGAKNIQSLLCPFVSYEEEKAYYEDCLHYDGEHGRPAGLFVNAKKGMQAIGDYLDLKLGQFPQQTTGPTLEFILSGPIALSEEDQAALVRFNAWLLERCPPETTAWKNFG